jgi:hypothetical protein
MYTCPRCQAVYFIDMLGQPEYGDMSVPVEIVTQGVTELTTEVSNEVSAEASEEAPFGQIPELNIQSLQSEFINESVFGSAAAEITDFANQDEAVSVLSYHLKVTGLDTKEAMLQFKEALDDSKFGWILQDIFLTIKNGQCELKDLSPVQAFVLAQRIQFLDIQTEWTQNVQI